MTERVHPGDEPAEKPAAPSSPSTQPPPPPGKRLRPASGTYVIQVPKDQIYRVPTPETAQRFEEYSRRRHRRSSSCCCLLSWILAVSFAVVLALGIAAGVLYLVYRPKFPHYTVEGLAVKGFNLTSRGALSPEFNVTVRAENPNRKIGIHYKGGGSVVISQSGVDLCSGTWPAFYQGPRNATVFGAALKGSGIRLSAAMRAALAAEQGRAALPLEVGARVPVRVTFGAVTTWTVTVKVRCEVTVDKLTATARVVSQTCRVKI